MKPAVTLAAAPISTRAGAAAGPHTPPPMGPGVGGRVRRALSVAAVVILAACGGGGDPNPVVTDPGGSIRGTVTYNAGAPVANATVTLTGNAQADRTTKSGADGA